MLSFVLLLLEFLVGTLRTRCNSEDKSTENTVAENLLVVVAFLTPYFDFFVSVFFLTRKGSVFPRYLFDASSSRSALGEERKTSAVSSFFLADKLPVFSCVPVARRSDVPRKVLRRGGT